MTKVLVDLDDQELTEAKRILGTTKNTEAVRLAVRARRELVEMFSEGVFSDPGAPAARRAAWS